MIRLAFIVSHPIQYYAPLHQRLALRDDIQIKVFFTWHDGGQVIRDSGFRRDFLWDIPLTTGYEYELVPNTAIDPGTHHFRGLRNPELVRRVLAWRPDVVHVTGWAWASHLKAMRAFYRVGVPVLFRGDSHLLDGKGNLIKWQLKRHLLKKVFSWPKAFLFVGQANRAYYETFGVAPDKLYYCPHSVDVTRFREPVDKYECAASAWRRELGLADDEVVLLFAGKFEPKKRPLWLMQTFLKCGTHAPVLVMVGNGVLETEVRTLAAAHQARFRVLPFQNQQQMPVVYRLGDLFVLPSKWGETWGLSVNEALACGRPVLVSDRVGCAADVVKCVEDGSVPFGDVFRWDDEEGLVDAIRRWADKAKHGDVRQSAIRRSRDFDIARTGSTLMNCVRRVTA